MMPDTMVMSFVCENDEKMLVDKGGVIKLLGGKEVPFVLKHGVYFVRLFIQNPDDPSMPGFTGQGS